MMIDDENKKKEEKNEKLLVDLCELYIMAYELAIPGSMLFICLPCLLAAALNEEESEEAQKDVEMALFALSNIGKYDEVERESYLIEIAEIIEYHQEHHNLTQLAYQCAWQFLVNRFYNDKSLEGVIANELHFAREAARELEELSKCVDWKRKEEGGGGKSILDLLAVLWGYFEHQRRIIKAFTGNAFGVFMQQQKIEP
eukprot:MONOS_6164.1-p1 / transcript=MONOS_6164.1 / gene=MONOS_6164 / organism=Monocercomonoides_exilis_PA203 / gene_product=unspecified product / transcript_product=unspecified product / location=Mono_scaffold00190:82399-83137(-) / protein_length=199 / sequence_SO=supercontig / SO=protein_coding / is_pseudo=false